MLYYTHYRKFVDGGRRVKLHWHWNCLLRGELGSTRWYQAIVTDGLHRRFLKRKLHNAEDSALYGARVCRRWQERGK